MCELNRTYHILATRYVITLDRVCGYANITSVWASVEFKELILWL